MKSTKGHATRFWRVKRVGLLAENSDPPALAH